MLYAESSAVLSWLLGEADGSRVRRALADTDGVVTSDLTLVECDRVLVRATDLGALADGKAAERRVALTDVSSRWTMLRVGEEVLERARRPFPHEPIRTLDALHLASAVAGRRVAGEMRFLSLDERLRASAKELGFAVLPA